MSVTVRKSPLYPWEANMCARIKSLIDEENLKTGMTFPEIAEKIGVSKNSMNDWRFHRCTPKARHQRAICLYFGVTSDWLIGLTTQVRDTENDGSSDLHQRRR